MTEMNLDELRAEAKAKYDHPTKPTPMLMNPRGVLELIERGDRLELSIRRILANHDAAAAYFRGVCGCDACMELRFALGMVAASSGEPRAAPPEKP